MAERKWRDWFVSGARPELKEVYLFSALFSLATALITIFEPVFFYKEGFEMAQIALYYALHYSLYLLLLPLGGKFVARFGVERSLTAAVPIFMAYFLILAALPQLPALFWIAWVILAFYKVLYWPAYYTAFTRFGSAKNRGTEVSMGLTLQLAAGVLGPVVGGIVAAQFGFPVLFLGTAAVALLSAVPLLKTRERYSVQEFPYWAPWRVIRGREHRRMVVSTVAWVEDLVNLVFWPVFAFLVLGGVAELGVVASLSVLLMSLLAWLHGELSDRYSSRWLIKLLSPALLVSYLVRPLATAPWHVLLANMLALSADMGVKIPFWKRLYSVAKRVGTLRYTVAFEMVLAMSKAAAAFAFAGVFLLFPPMTAFIIVFITAGAFALLYTRL